MTHRCTIVIVTAGDSRGILKTMNSLDRQAGALAQERIIQVDPERMTGQEHLTYRRTLPWSGKANLIESSLSSLVQRVLATSSSEWFLFLSPGDQLFSNALALMFGQPETHECLGVVGPCRITNGPLSWSHPEVEALFGQPDSVISATKFDPVNGSLATMGMVHRRYLENRDGAMEGQFTIVKSYVGARFHQGDASSQHAHIAKHESAGRGFSRPIKPRYPSYRLGKVSKGAWVFGERLGQGAEDNAWALFRYCRDHLPEMDCWFVVEDFAELEIPPTYQDRVLSMGDPAWRNVLKRASTFLYTNSARDVLQSLQDRHLYPDARHIYLTHGLLAYSPGVYQRNHPYFDKVVCVSELDAVAASTEWSFPASKFIRAGMSRWDDLRPIPVSRKEILFCPTWRQTLRTEMWDGSASLEKSDIEHFECSQYFRAIRALLCSRRLHSFLDRHDLHLNLRLHFRAAPYLPLFREVATDRIHVFDPQSDDRDLATTMCESVALITDYSSIMWDMAYMEKPVVCYQFDRPAFLAERRRSAFSLPESQLIADVCCHETEVLEALERFALRDFSLEPNAKQLLDQFIPNRRGGNCERILSAINQSPIDSEPPGSPPRQIPFSQLAHPWATSKQELSGHGTALIGPGLQPGPVQNSCSLLSPGDWDEVLRSGDFETLHVAPFLDASDAWGSVFFDRVAATELIRSARVVAAEKGVPFQVHWSATLPFGPEYLNLDPAEISAVEPLAIEEAVDISVIVPVFNGAAHIARCLDSLLSQDVQGDFEIIVVDDGSDDDTPAILSTYERSYYAVRVLNQENSRQGMARNHGLMNARGEFVTFVDADDALAEGALAELLLTARRHDADVSIGIVATWTVGEFSQRINQAYYHYHHAPDVITAQRWPHVFYDPSCVGKLYRREFLLRHRVFFPQSFHEDQAFMFQLFSLDPKCALAREIVYLYIARPVGEGVSGTQQFTEEKFEQILLVGNYALQRVRHAELPGILVRKAEGYLLMRYDRFLWKRKSNQQVPTFDQASWIRMARTLQSILEPIDLGVIIEHCRYHCMVFLCLKYGYFDRALAALDDGGKEELKRFKASGLLDEKTVKGIESAEIWQYAPDYYRAHRVDAPPGSDDIVTDMSYGYRLGDLLVGGRSRDALLTRVMATLKLVGDMVTKRGRTRETQRRAQLGDQSTLKLLEHSESIKASPAFVAGVRVLESLSKGHPRPWKLWQQLQMLKQHR